MNITAIVLAAGKGRRFKSKVPKPLAKIRFKPVLIYSLESLCRHPRIRKIIIVANAANFKKILSLIKRYHINKVACVVLGGKRRQDSVSCGLKRIIDDDCDFVLIHDSARPFTDSKIISRVIEKAKKSGCAIAGVPVKATIKKAVSSNSRIVDKTLDRRMLWEIQTPQVFRKDLILSAYKKFKNVPVTDDASLVEKLGRKVSIVLGSYNNIKITTPEDLALAQYISLRK